MDAAWEAPTALERRDRPRGTRIPPAIGNLGGWLFDTLRLRKGLPEGGAPDGQARLQGGRTWAQSIRETGSLR